MGFFLKLRYSTLLALGVLTIYIYTAKLTLQCLVDIQHHTYVQTILSCEKKLLYSLQNFHMCNIVLLESPCSTLHPHDLQLEVCNFWLLSPNLPNPQLLPLALSVFSMYEPFSSFFLFWKIPHISEIIQYLSFFIWFISLRKMPSRSMSIHIVANGKISFFVMA